MSTSFTTVVYRRNRDEKSHPIKLSAKPVTAFAQPGRFGDNSFTSPCKNTNCKSINCTFAHSPDQLKIIPCKFDRKCTKDVCTFFHSPETRKSYFDRLIKYKSVNRLPRLSCLKNESYSLKSYVKTPLISGKVLLSSQSQPSLPLLKSCQATRETRWTETQRFPVESRSVIFLRLKNIGSWADVTDEELGF